MKVSVIISNRNDLAMLAVTIRSALEELTAINAGGEVVIVDNSDKKYQECEAVKAMIPDRYLGEEVKLYYQDYPCLFTARDEAARRASGEYIINVDSHCIFGRDSIKDAVEFMDRRANDPLIGFGHMPLNWLCQAAEAGKHDMEFLHGSWGKLYDDERPISWKGMPWICRRKWFLNDLGGYGALSEHRLSWGGGDMYLGLKTWILGYQNWSIVSRPVIHIGPFPKVARQWMRYRVYKQSGTEFATFGWLVAFYALGARDDYFDRPEIKSFLEFRINEWFKQHLPQAKKMAERDRKWIAHRSKRTFYDLVSNAPWKSGKVLNEYVPFEPYFTTYRKHFRVGFVDPRAIKPEDWYLFQRIVKENDIKNVVEFGSGLSTLLWQALKLRTTSLETDIDFMNQVAGLTNNGVFLVHWNNKTLPRNIGPADWSASLAFVDGVDPRDRQIELAKMASRKIIVHDGYSKPTRGFIKEHLSDRYLSRWREVKVNSTRSRFFVKEGLR